MRKTLPVVFVVLFAGVRSQAQSPAVLAAADLGAQPDPAIPASPAQIGIGGNPQAQGGGPAPFGNGEQPVLRFAGDNGPQNEFTFTLSDQTGYSDNVLGSNINRHGDFFTAVGPQVAFVTGRKHVSFMFSYAPYFQIYKRFSSYDALNQSLNLDAAVEVSPRLQLRVRSSTSEYYYGLFNSNAQQVVPGLGPPGGVPLYVNPETRTITNFDRVDIAFSKSDRTTIDFFGGYFLTDIKNPGVNITYGNFKGGNAGWSYSYRASPRGSFSLTYTYGESQYSGIASRYSNQNASLSYAYQISKTASISFFGGPEYTYINETLLIPIQTIFGIVDLPYPIHKPEWDWSAGFNVSKTTLGTTFFLFGSRYVSGGGGLLTAVNSNSGSLGMSRRLPWNWTGNLGLTYAQYQALSFGGLQNGKFTTAFGNISLNHKLGERASVNLNYNYTSQRGSRTTSGALAPGLYYGNLDSNRMSVGINWQIGKVHLGH